MRQAIITKYLGPTNHRGARILVKAQAGRKTYPWNDALDVNESHQKAAKYFAIEWGWLETHFLAGGATPDGTGYAFVLVPQHRETPLRSPIMSKKED